jgi:hypothetical protein
MRQIQPFHRAATRCTSKYLNPLAKKAGKKATSRRLPSVSSVTSVSSVSSVSSVALYIATESTEITERCAGFTFQLGRNVVHFEIPEPTGQKGWLITAFAGTTLRVLRDLCGFVHCHREHRDHGAMRRIQPFNWAGTHCTSKYLNPLAKKAD